MIERHPVDSPLALELIADLDADLRARYPEDAVHFFQLDEAEVLPGRGGFYVVRVDGEPAGCGAFRTIGPGVAELKRMYVRPRFRGRRLSSALVAHLELEARAIGITHLKLETGPNQHEAIALYEHAGFTRCDCWGDYEGEPHSLCYEKWLN